MKTDIYYGIVGHDVLLANIASGNRNMGPWEPELICHFKSLNHKLGHYEVV